MCPTYSSGQRIMKHASKQKMLPRSPIWMLYSVPTVSNKNINAKVKTEARISCYVYLGKTGTI